MKGFCKKAFSILTALAIISGIVFLTGNGLINENVVFAAENLENKNVTVEFNGRTLNPDQNVNLLDIAKTSFIQDGKITVGTEPIEKEVILLIDSCYKSTLIPDDIIGILEKCLFSFNDLTIQGNDTKINGDVFTLNDLIVKSSKEQVTLSQEAHVEYNEFKHDKNGPPQNASAFFTDSGDRVRQVSDKKREEINQLVKESEDNDNPGGYVKLFRYIQQKVANPPQRDKAQFLYDESTANIHFGSGNIAHYDDNTIIKRLDPNPYPGSNEYTRNYYNYEISDSDFVLRYSMYFDGNLKISVPNITKDFLPGTEVIFIFAEGDIVFQGNTSNLVIENNDESQLSVLDTLVLISRHGNIYFQPGSTELTAIVFAPEGNVTIQGNNVDFNGCFAGKNVFCEASGSTFFGPSSDTTDKINNELNPTEGFEKVVSAINYLPESFDNNTKVGVIKYSDSADINDSRVRENWTLYDLNPETRNEKDAFKDYIKTLTADTDTERSNLGDAMRRALGVFQSELCDRDSEKFMVIFTGLDPNAYSATENKYVTDVNLDITKGSAFIYDEGSQPLKSGNGYVEEIVKAINDFNNLNESNIHIILVDLSLFRQESNKHPDGTPKKIIPQLTDLGSNLGINIVPGETQATAVNGNVYYRPTKEEVENHSSENFIINKIAEYTNKFNTRLALYDLEIKSAEFKLDLPRTLKPVSLIIKDIDGNEFDKIDLSATSVQNNSYSIEHNIVSNISKFAKIITVDEGKTYTLNAGEITIELYVNNDDGSFNSADLIIERDVNYPGPVITFEFIDSKGKTYYYDLPFENIKFKVIYKKDIT